MTWADVSARMGRNDMPYALAKAVLLDHTITDPADIARGINDAWTLAEWPVQTLDPFVWASLFTETDPSCLTYVHDGEIRDRADLPTQVTLYRGAIEEHRLGMSWTDDLERATWFAHRFDTVGGDVGKVYQVTVDAEAILGRFHERRLENEWVLDVSQLEDYEVTEIG